MNKEAVTKYFLNLLEEMVKEEEIADILTARDKETFIELLDGKRGELYKTYQVQFFSGLYKMALIFEKEDEYSQRYIVKIDFSKYDHCSCAFEEKRCEEINATHPSMSQYFAQIWFGGYVGEIEIPFYIMERAKVNCDEVETISYDYCSSKGLELDDENELFDVDGYSLLIDNDVLYCFESIYGEDVRKEIISFLMDSGINDIHDNNVGFIGDRLVIIDYSGI